MTEHKAIKDEIKENTPSFAGINAQVVGALTLIICELRRMNDNLEKLTKRIQSDVI